MKNKFLNMFCKCGIGMRTLKTIISISIVFIIAWLIKYDSPFYACIACVMSTKENPKASIAYGLQRVIGTIIAGCVAIVMLWFTGLVNHQLLKYLFVVISVFLGIVICNLIGKKTSSAICGVVILAIMLNHSVSKYEYAISRSIETIIGIVIAIIVNYIPGPSQIKERRQAKLCKNEDKEEIEEENDNNCELSDEKK